VKKRNLLLGLCVVLVAAGCATSGGMSPEQAVQAKVEAWAAAMVAQDLDGMMALFSNDFEHYEWGDKEGAKEFMSEAIDMGYLEDIEISLDDMTLEVDDDEVIAYPIELSASFGSATITLTFIKEDYGYLISGLDVEGV